MTVVLRSVTKRSYPPAGGPSRNEGTHDPTNRAAIRGNCRAAAGGPLRCGTCADGAGAVPRRGQAMRLPRHPQSPVPSSDHAQHRDGAPDECGDNDDHPTRDGAHDDRAHHDDRPTRNGAPATTSRPRAGPGPWSRAPSSRRTFDTPQDFFNRFQTQVFTGDTTRTRGRTTDWLGDHNMGVRGSDHEAPGPSRVTRRRRQPVLVVRPERPRHWPRDDFVPDRRVRTGRTSPRTTRSTTCARSAGTSRWSGCHANGLR